ncbi:MAG TPA: MFS transporter [Verrucomicrobiae bacterium]
MSAPHSQTGESTARHGLITSYLILNVTSGTVAGALQLAVPLYALALQAATAQIGLIRGISGIGMLLLVIPAGFLVDHYGSKRLFLIGGLIGTVMTFALSFAHTPTAIAIIMGLAGLFASLKMTALNSSFFSNLQSMGLEKAGWFKGSMSIGLTFLGPLAGGYLAHVISYGALFKLLAAATLIPISLVFFFHNDPARKETTSLREAVRRQLKDFSELIRRRELYLPLFTESLSTSFFATFSAFIVVLAVQSLHLSATAASVLLSVEGGLFIVTVFVAGQLILRCTVPQLYRLSTAIVVAGIVVLVLAGSFAALVAATVVLGIGLGLANLIVSSRIGQMRGDKGKLVGLFSAAVGVGISVGPMLGGVIGAWLGTRAIFLAFIPLFLALPLVASLQEKRNRMAVEALPQAVPE